MFYKKVLSTVMALMLSVNISSTVNATDSATSGSCGDDVTWSFNDSTGTLTISGTGNMTDYPTASTPWKNIEKTITSVIIENGVTSIGTGAFYCVFSLEAITVPNSVTSIGVCAFYNCNKLTSITIPGSVTSIGNMAFDSCLKLSSVTYTGKTAPTMIDYINGALTIVSSSTVFDMCYKLKAVNVPRNYKNNTFCGIPIRRAPTKKISKPNLYRYAITL